MTSLMLRTKDYVESRSEDSRDQLFLPFEISDTINTIRHDPVYEYTEYMDQISMREFRSATQFTPFGRKHGGVAGFPQPARGRSTR